MTDSVKSQKVKFLSTPSARRATLFDVMTRQGTVEISIHALREEGDRLCLLHLRIGQDFYPRPPRGGRQPRGQWS